MANLSRERFTGLLASLHSDRVVAAEKYVMLRHKLVRFFERFQYGDPEDLADDALDRIAKKLETEAIHNLNSFAYSVAVKISLEIQKDSARFVSIDGREDWEDSLVGERDPEARIIDSMRKMRNAQCLNACLQRLRAGDHELLLEYYEGEKQERIRRRQELAEKRATTLARLRSEVNLFREKLRACVNRCLRSNLKFIQTRLK
ncbi:MAG: hypothetical protein LAO78_10350 [Acidobacteriia bacterium]|nr:hypothetical protein [Terriglobia bacterium]